MADRFRLLPEITPENAHFWQGGAEGRLQFLRCEACGTFLHPPGPICGECRSTKLSVAAVSGKARLATFTVNHHPWLPGWDPPYVVAIVELEEQPSLRLTTELVNCPESKIEIGMGVQVVFEDIGEGIFLPNFEPADASAREAGGD